MGLVCVPAEGCQGGEDTGFHPYQGPDLEKERKGAGPHRRKQLPTAPTHSAQAVEGLGLSSTPQGGPPLWVSLSSLRNNACFLCKDLRTRAFLLLLHF